MSLTASALRLEAIHRTIDGVCLLDEVCLAIEAGQKVAVMGRSGVGKTTLLHIASGLDFPDAGRVWVADQCLSELPEPQLTQWRAKHIGLVFQDFNLIDSLTVKENMELPLWLCGMSDRADRIHTMAKALGVSALLERLPQTLSGGEKQRVAIGRALIHQPALVLADEPTGNLDETHAQSVLALFSDITQSLGCAVLLVTHDPVAAGTCHRIFELQGGQLYPKAQP